LLVIISFIWAACGTSSISAPLVDLPAPITGRVVVSSPDANGYVKVTGTAGAVPGGSLVMAVNESVTAIRISGILNLFVKDSYAQETQLPAICNEAGHACAFADENGEFVLLLKAAVGDSIAIYIIDLDGNIRSPALRIAVPELLANCAGKEVTGRAVDIAILPPDGIPVLLKQGSDTTTNQIVVGSTSPTTIDIPGCYAHSIAIVPTTTDFTAVVTSKDDKKLLVGHLIDGALQDTHEFSLDAVGEPMHVAFADSTDEVIVAIRTSSSVELDRISLTNGSVIGTPMKPMAALGPIKGLVRSTGLDIMPMDPSVGHYLGLLISDAGSATSAYLTIFQADGIIHKATWAVAEFVNFNNNPPVDGIADAALFKIIPVSGPTLVYIALLNSTDQFFHSLHKYMILNPDDSNRPLTFDWDISTIQRFNALQIDLSFELPTVVLRNIVVSESSPSNPIAIISDANGDLYRKDLSTTDIPGSTTWAGSGHDISAIAIDDISHTFFGADATDGVAVSSATPMF